MRRYLCNTAISSHSTWLSKGNTGDSHVFSIVLHSLEMIFLETSLTLEEARATAVSAIISAFSFFASPAIETLMKLSSTTSMSSLTFPIVPHILAWMEGYISTSLILAMINLSSIVHTLCRLESSACLTNFSRLGSQGV